MNEELTEQEAYREILRKMHEKDDLIKTQKETIERLEEVLKKHDKETKDEKPTMQRNIGYCDNCEAKLTQKDVENEVCPHCGSKSYTPY